ncbi:MAG: riboflavin biosynthesis protein RibF [Firmicutes bacterium]|nr:riboflavin biosynthesis protein RibF [Bacillota bacterium]
MGVDGPFPEEACPVLAMGVFDGVHLGHQSLLAAALELARSRGAPLWALTFWPHPAEVLAGPAAGGRAHLSSLEEKVRLLGMCGVELVLVLRFDREVAAVEARDFVRRSLAGGLRPTAVAVGFNFTFGRGGLGTPALLRELGRESGFEVMIHPAVRIRGEVVSSSAVRACLERGDVERAGVLLGRPYSLVGPVEPGAGRGRRLGFPTANVVLPPDLARPSPGVYICSVTARPDAAATVTPSGCSSDRPGDGAEVLPAVANLGTCPTFAEGAAEVEPRLEVHVLRGEAPTYGDRVRVFFHRRLRDERRFDGPDSLREQVARDREAAARFFGLESDEVPGVKTD